MKAIASLLLISLLTTSQLMGECEEIPTLCCEKRFCLCPYFEQTLGSGLGFDHGYSSPSALLTLSRFARIQPFADFRYHFLSEHKKALNAGGGLRYLTNSCCPTLLGLNVYYDFRERCIGNFNQIGAGFEYYCSFFSFTLNSYFPLVKKRCCPQRVFDDYLGEFVVKCQQQELSYKGVDAEFRASFIKYCCLKFYLGAGPYYYRNCCGNTITGGRMRGGLQFSQFVSLEGVGTYDGFFKGRFAGRLILSIPLQKLCPQRSCCFPDYVSQMCNGCGPFVYRNELILLEKGCCWDFNYED